METETETAVTEMAVTETAVTEMVVRETMRNDENSEGHGR
jgi:hypothetical protein